MKGQDSGGPPRHNILFVMGLCLVFVLGLLSGRGLRRGEAPPSVVYTERRAVSAAASPLPQVRVDLNRASLGELMGLDGIGEALAKRILAYRKTNGLFQYPYEIMNVSGIGEKTYERLRDSITVG